jgi:hypothetical protein
MRQVLTLREIASTLCRGSLVAMFSTGQKVVCVDDKFPAWVKKLYTALPVEGVTYVVRGSTVGVSFSPAFSEGEICVYLIGLVNPKSFKAPFREFGFKAERFRPLDELQGRQEEHELQSDPLQVEIAVPGSCDSVDSQP